MSRPAIAHPCASPPLTPSRSSRLQWAALVALSFALVGPAAASEAAPRSTLRAYANDAELNAALDRWRSQQPSRQARGALSALGSALPATESSMVAKAADAAAPAVSPAPGVAGANESITNVQTAGVDEGGIVKRAGDHLLILRRGRLFTVRVGGDRLAPVSAVEAYAPGADPRGAWYDELLVSGSTVVVVGYSYARGGTEIGLFDLHGDGTLAYRATWHLRSFDYYSSRNYASRLVDGKLVFYTPQMLQPWQRHGADWMPALRRWHGKATQDDFRRLLPATRIYRTDDDFDPAQPLALHSVTSCDLATPDLQCESTAVLGPAGRVFYVSTGSVYVWTAERPARRKPWGAAEAVWPRPRSAVFRLPLDGAAPTALKTAGVPVDQMSFLEDGGGALNVLLRGSGPGEGMWGSERGGAGAMALLRVPLSVFGDGTAAAGPQHYRALPPAPEGALQNRFVGDWLLWGAAAATRAFALRYAGDSGPVVLSPGHAVERIEGLGAHALLVGPQGADLYLTAVRLGRRDAELGGRHVQAAARQGESRTHGFFYRPTGPDEGLLGLPLLQTGTARPGADAAGTGASVLYVRHREGGFAALGALQASSSRAVDDACKASCVDWYGNARPIFIGDRIFALLGYELVEGRLAGGIWRERIVERQRVDFAPRRAFDGDRFWPFQ